MLFISNLEEILDEQKLLIPILSDPKKHWSVNRLSFIYGYYLGSEREFVLGLNHNDTENVEIRPTINFLLEDDYIYHKKFLTQYNKDFKGYEAELVHWFETNQRFEVEENKIIRSYWNQFHNFENINDSIPIMKWLEHCRNIKDMFLISFHEFKVTEPFKKYQNLIDNLTIIEQNGLFIENENSKFRTND